MFGVVHPDQAATNGKNNGSRNDRPRKGPPSGFVDTDDATIPAPPGLSFKFLGRSQPVDPQTCETATQRYGRNRQLTTRSGTYALAGSAAYDVISLLEDARRDVSPALRQAMMEHYLAQARKKSLAVTPEQFRAEAAFFAGQRNAKIIGIFARLARRDGKMRYLSLLPRVWGHMESDLAHPAMRAIQDFYGRLIPQSARGELSLEGAPT